MGDYECVFRGGSWGSLPIFARVANRSGDAPGYCDNYLGVRLVRVIDTLQRIAEINNER